MARVFPASLSILRGAGPESDGVLAGGSGLEDGFEFTHGARSCLARADSTVRAQATNGDERLDVWAVSTGDCKWWRVVAPGPPGQDERAFRVLRAHAGTGTHQFVWSWSGDVIETEFGETIRVTVADGSVHGISYGIDPTVFGYLGDKADGQVIDAGAF